MTAPDVRVGIVSWNTAALLDRCLSALPAALGGLRAEVIVVDNASADDSVNVARGHAGVRVELQSENLGYARGMNLALAGSTAPVLLALNPDTEAAPSAGCTPGDFSGVDVAGKIALVQRGACNFAVKAANAKVAGAIGVVGMYPAHATHAPR